jgi:nitric oxide reductase activation protein
LGPLASPASVGSGPAASTTAVSTTAALDALAVQSALLASGSLEPALMRRLLGRPAAARRYLAIEGWRALSAMASSLPGVPLVTVATKVELLSLSPDESLAIALSSRKIADVPESFGVIRPRRILAAGPVEEAGAPTRGDRTSPRPVAVPSPAFDDDEETESASTILKWFSSPLQNPLMTRLMKKLGSGTQKSDGPGGAELPVGGARVTTRPGSKAEVSLLPAALLPTELVSDRGSGWLYPEWDERVNRYRQQWCTVREVDPRPEDLRLLDPPPSGELRRCLARLGVGLERRRRQTQGDDIDIDAAVEARVDLLTGSTADGGVYIESQRRRRSLAVLVLIDISGSVADRASVLGSAHEQQCRAAAMLLDTLHGLGDRVALYGFRSQGRGAVYLVRVKSFDETVNGVTYERLGGLAPGGYTRLGAAIRHGAHILTTQAGTERRLLVVLSDGFPYDDGYEGTYAEADARRALAETRRQGVGCLCLTLGASTAPRGLRKVFGTAAYANADRLEDLTEHLGPLFRKAIMSADLQRRLAQRVQRGRRTERRRQGVA